MLASITPLGERARRNSFAVTATAFAIAATSAGAAIGALSGEVGRLVLPEGRWRLPALAVALALALAAELRLWRLRVPSVRRLVNEEWLYSYRGWVYGAGFGAQLGAGVCTIVKTAAVYAMLVAAMLARSPALGALAIGVFGALRAASLLAGARVQTPEQLVALHTHLAALRRLALRAGVALDGALLALTLALAFG
jgi:hypothetical protein